MRGKTSTFQLTVAFAKCDETIICGYHIYQHVQEIPIGDQSAAVYDSSNECNRQAMPVNCDKEVAEVLGNLQCACVKLPFLSNTIGEISLFLLPTEHEITIRVVIFKKTFNKTHTDKQQAYRKQVCLF